MVCHGLLLVSILEIIFVHYVTRSFGETIKLPKEMPKVAKCLKCLKLRYSVDFNKKTKGRVLFYFPDFWIPIRPESIIHNKDGATCRVVAEGEA
jgi:hypothetical protein